MELDKGRISRLLTSLRLAALFAAIVLSSGTNIARINREK